MSSEGPSGETGGCPPCLVAQVLLFVLLVGYGLRRYRRG